MYQILYRKLDKPAVLEVSLSLVAIMIDQVAMPRHVYYSLQQPGAFAPIEVESVFENLHRLLGRSLHAVLITVTV